VASSLTDLALLADARRDYPESERRYRESLPIWRAAGLAVDEVRAIVAIGRALQLQGKLDEAEPMVREGLARLRATQGNESAEVGGVTEVLGNIAMRRGDAAEAERLHREALAIRRKVYGPRSPSVRVQLQNVAFIREARGDTAGAEPFLREALDIMREAFPGGNADVEFSRAWLASNVCSQGRSAEAEPELRAATRALDAARSGFLSFAASAHGDCLRREGRYDEAERVLLAAFSAIEAEPAVNAARRTTAIRRLVALYEAWAKPGKAAEWRGKLG
jgi:tetratricopeptide (TPR) repeat protein